MRKRVAIANRLWGAKDHINMDLVGKPRSKSSVWLYFGFKGDKNGQPLNPDEAICRLCRKIVLVKSGNTTNLRSHLTRRHRADFFESSSSSTPGSLFEQACLDQEELFDDVHFMQNALNQTYVPDAVLPSGEPWLQNGPSRALLSLPSCLLLCQYSGAGMRGSGSSSEDHTGDMKVYAKYPLQQGVMFGPFVGETCRQMPNNLKYSWAVRDDAAFIYIDAADENKSNWMRYIRYTSREEEHNMYIFQFYRHIYYRVSKPIPEGTELRVWIGKDYASMLGLGIGDGMKCEVGDKETALRLLQDIQLVTLPESSSTSLWSDHSQSQSPMPLISDVTSNSDMVNEQVGISLPSTLSVSTPFVSVPSPFGQFMDRYDFMPGTEKLLRNPRASEHSSWYFFGFEPDPTGRPLDRSTAVCKLCIEHVGCAGGEADLKNHLMNKHHIRLREITKDRGSGGAQQAQPMMLSSGLVSTTPQVLSAQVIEAVANFLILDLQPPAVVEGQGFRHLIHTLLPSNKELPSPSQLENLLKEHHTKGKACLAHQLRIISGTQEVVPDYTAPIEPRRRGQHPIDRREIPNNVTLSVDIWSHNWHGTSEPYLTLWAHCIDLNYNSKNVALTSQRLMGRAVKDYTIQTIVAQVKAMAQEWGISQSNLVLIGGEGRKKMMQGRVKRERVRKACGSVPHPNSTTFLERDDSASSEEPHGSESSHSTEGVPFIPCFFSAVQECIEEVMSHPVISKTLGQFHDILSPVFLAPSQDRSSCHVHSLLQTFTRQEWAELTSWTHSRPTWYKLYPLLSILIKHKSPFCELIKEVTGEGSGNAEAPSENSSSSNCPTNSTSNCSSANSTMRSDWKVVEDLCLVLRPLDVACRTLAKEGFPRLSLVKPILIGLLSRHLVSRQGDSSSSILREVKRMMRKSLASCYDNPVVNMVLCVACSLDPQFRGLGFMNEKEQKTTLDWLKKEAVRLVKEDRRIIQIKRSPSTESPESEGDILRRSKRLKNNHRVIFKDILDKHKYEKEDEDEHVNEDEESDAFETDDNDSVDCSSQAGQSGMEFLLGDLFCSAPQSKQSSVEESVDMEMSIFRADKGASLGVEPLQWWRTTGGQFPLLSTVARAYLAVPAVAGSAAKDFAQEGPCTLYRKRANIPPETLDAVLFLHHNHMPDTEPGLTTFRSEDKNNP